jgi:hypothetical protein
MKGGDVVLHTGREAKAENTVNLKLWASDQTGNAFYRVYIKAPIGIIFPWVGFLLLNMAYLFYSNDDLHPLSQFRFVPKDTEINDAVMRLIRRWQCLGYSSSTTEGILSIQDQLTAVFPLQKHHL